MRRIVGSAPDRFISCQLRNGWVVKLASPPANATVNTNNHKKSTSGLAVAGLVLGLIALLSCWIPLFNVITTPFAILGLVFGIIGIVASRLTEIYHRPSVVLTRTDDVATGSARSVPGFDVYGAVAYCRDLLENFGGHTYAAGLSMKVENVPEFRRRFEAYVESHILPEQTCATINVDAVINFRDINRKFFADLKRFAPYGPENPKPVFCTKRVYDYGTSKVVGRDQEHIKLELVDSKSNNVMNGIAFGQSSQARYIKTKQAFDIAYTIEENIHKRGDVQLQIEDIRPVEHE